MTEAVLDASVIIKWWRSEEEQHLQEARALRQAFETGELSVVIPPLLFLEVINAFGRRWDWSQAALVELVDSLQWARFDVAEPQLRTVAFWTAQDLTACDASYVALADSRGIPLITDDVAILSAASDIARPLAPDDR